MNDQSLLSMEDLEGDSLKFFIGLSYFTAAVILFYTFGMPYLSSLLHQLH